MKTTSKRELELRLHEEPSPFVAGLSKVTGKSVEEVGNALREFDKTITVPPAKFISGLTDEGRVQFYEKVKEFIKNYKP